MTPRLISLEDGLSFRLKTDWVDVVPADNGKATFWTGQKAGSVIGHPSGGGVIQLSKIVGPAVQTGPDTFQIAFGRAESTPNRRNNEFWLYAHHSGDGTYKSMIQQVLVRLNSNTQGLEQRITFPAIGDQKSGTRTLQLNAASDAGLPVSYYVVSGPAEIQRQTLRFTQIPPRAKFPMKVTIVAWQWGRSLVPQIKTAAPVEQTFFLLIVDERKSTGFKTTP